MTTSPPNSIAATARRFLERWLAKRPGATDRERAAYQAGFAAGALWAFVELGREERRA
jgi:hypothetical protein